MAPFIIIMKLKFIATKEAILKDYIRECGVSKTLGRKIKLYGSIYVNSVLVKNHFPLKINDEIILYLPPEFNQEINHNYLEILFEDSDILIVNKPNNLAIQPSANHFDDNLIARVQGYYERNSIVAGCHVLTRLDYPTSGIVLIAKNPYAHNLLSKTEIIRQYLLKTDVELPHKLGKICLPIDRDLSSKIKRRVAVLGKNAITLYRLIETRKDEYLYRVRIITGRTHQIRVHFSHLGSPIIGDILYGGKESKRLFLHCSLVEFIHPINLEKMKIEKIPLDFLEK